MTSERGTWLVTIIFQLFCPLYRGPKFFGPLAVFFVERSITLCPYLGGSTIRGSTVLYIVVYIYTRPCITLLTSVSLDVESSRVLCSRISQMSWELSTRAMSKAVSPSFIIVLCIIQYMLGGEVCVSKTKSILLLILSHSW